MVNKLFAVGSFVMLTITCVLASDGVEDFKAILASKVEQAGKENATVVKGKDGWLFFVPELRHLSVGTFWGDAAAKVSKATSPTAADPLPAILDFKAQLDRAGIALLVVPVPAKAAIYPEKIVDGAVNSASARLDASDAEFIELLKQKGLNVIDLAPIFIKYRSEHPDDLLYSREDTHWSGNGIRVAADAITDEVSKAKWFAGLKRTKYSASTGDAKVVGDLASMLQDPKPGPEAVTLTQVKDPGGTLVASSRQSPLVLLGDSHSLIYSIGDDMLASGSGLPENLALKLGFAPDVVAVRGSGATPARVNLTRRADNMAGKEIVVWCFTVREFTEGQGWRKVPVIRPGS
jgi:alginate O-acetyltransferase complex protein AlgJ